MSRAIGALILAPIFLAYVPSFIGFKDAVRHRDTPVDVAARELKRIAKPSDTLLVWGYEPWLFSCAIPQRSTSMTRRTNIPG
jgi:hypothetical protein